MGPTASQRPDEVRRRPSLGNTEGPKWVGCRAALDLVLRFGVYSGHAKDRQKEASPRIG